MNLKQYGIDVVYKNLGVVRVFGEEVEKFSATVTTPVGDFTTTFSRVKKFSAFTHSVTVAAPKPEDLIGYMVKHQVYVLEPPTKEEWRNSLIEILDHISILKRAFGEDWDVARAWAERTS